MPIEPINLTGLISAMLGISVILIPVIGLTARYALNPTVEALARLFENRGADENLRILERRVALQEQEIAALHSAFRGLAEGRDFDRQLESGAANADPPSSA
jgi:hypothetical protein